MIKLTKGAKPAILIASAAEWTEVIAKRLAKNEKPTKAEKSKYNNVEVKTSLKAETHGKCAYCESKFSHVTYGDIEHAVPKNVSPDLWFDWNNLTIACDVCNTNKGEVLGLVDPYDPDPEPRFIFAGAAMFGLDEAAEITERTLELNRSELVSKRIEKVEYLTKLLSLIVRTRSPELRKTLAADFKLELADEKEYAALARTMGREAAAKGILGN